jgi:hypothetical protein
VIGMRGFTTYADEALQDDQLTQNELTFLKTEFNSARDRMTGFATTATTVGSLVLVLVALLVGFAKGTQDQSDKVLTASQNYDLLVANCTDKATDPACTEAKRQQALQSVENARNHVSDLSKLNKAQAIAAGFVLLGFLLGLAGILTNPVPGPDTAATGTKRFEAWRTAVERLNRKRNWIICALVAEVGAVISILYVAVNVF